MRLGRKTFADYCFEGGVGGRIFDDGTNRYYVRAINPDGTFQAMFEVIGERMVDYDSCKDHIEAEPNSTREGIDKSVRERRASILEQ
jgi:hypothetical protein